MGREQENGEISRLLHDAQAEEQAVHAAATQNVNTSHYTGNHSNQSSAGDTFTVGLFTPFSKLTTRV